MSNSLSLSIWSKQSATVKIKHQLLPYILCRKTTSNVPISKHCVILRPHNINVVKPQKELNVQWHNLNILT